MLTSTLVIRSVASRTATNSNYFPTIGYDNSIELDDPRRRREEHLPDQEFLPHRGDPVGTVTNLFTPNSDWITYRTTVSTSDSDSEGQSQIAISPGYLTREWHENGRHYFSYDMGDVKTLDFYAFISARYDVKREIYQGAANPIAIEVCHIPAHTYDADDMIAASKAGLGYYEKNFSPFQFRHYASSSFHATARSPNRFPTRFRFLRE